MNNDIIQSLTGTRPVYGVQMKYKLLKSSVFIGCSFLIGSIFAADEKPDIKSGGGTTVYSTGTNAFSLPSKNIDIMKRLDFSVGNSFFKNPWVIAPSSTDARDGLGPLFNTNGCQSCHIRDGRGHAPSGPEDSAVSMLVRLSVETPEGVFPEPVYGGQLQDFAIPGVEPEGRISVSYTSKTVTYPDGEKVELRIPHLEIKDLGYGPMHPKAQFSSRIATPMIGLGLLEAIKAEDILAQADSDDKNGDGISGRANEVLDHETHEPTLGRFGWKAGQPNVRQQNASAFNGDLGIDSHLFPKDDCTEAQKACLEAPNGRMPVVKNDYNNKKGHHSGEHDGKEHHGKPEHGKGEHGPQEGLFNLKEEPMELSNKILNFVTFYAKNLGVPARRNADDPQVIKGETLFSEINCSSCHTPSYTTGEDSEMPWLANQKIYPYSDMLLHDMGEDLADHRPEAQANGFEWRTQPLWGIGLTEVVSGVANYLHDGRAETIEEAILWHGGEAEASKKEFMALKKEDREAVLAFLKSL